MKFKMLSALLLFFFLQTDMTSAQEFSQLPGVIHIHTTFSSGHYSIEQLVSMAKEKGLEVLVLTDHDLVVMEYGIFPLQNLVKKREERKSILKLGPEKYLQKIARVNGKQKDVLVIPGVQSSPFYYWTGSLFGEGLTINDYRKELLVIGMQTPEDYRGLPILHKGFYTQYVKVLLPQSIFFLVSFFLAIYLFFQKGALKAAGGFIAVFSLIMLINYHPFKGSRFDPYHGDQGIAPFQELIDYVRKRDGLVFWAHPESNYAKAGVQLGPVKMVTKHYPDDLLASKDYTGFSAIYGDNITVTDPGMHWDQTLNEYCRGKRSRPPWGISGADFHVEKDGLELDTFQTIFLTRSRATGAVLEALDKGRFYAIRKGDGPRLILDQFHVKDNKSGNSAIMGQEMEIQGITVVEGKLSASDKGRYPVKVSVVRGGELVTSIKGQTPLEFHFEDQDGGAGKTFYRLDVRGDLCGRLLSNPIFVTKK